MPYVERKIIAGKTIEIERFYTSRYHAPGERAEKREKTKEAARRCNNRKAERILRTTMNANFQDGDLHINFGYIRKKDGPDRTREEMKHDIQIFLRHLRKVYKAAGHELKYIHVMEIGSKGARHHHMVINQPGIDTRMIQKAWEKAYKEKSMIHFSPLNSKGDYAKLAAYLIKYTCETVGDDDALMKKRWNCSRNLIRPVPRYKIIRSAKRFAEEPKAIKGYEIVKDSVEVGIHNEEHFGYGYMHYRMVRLE